MTKTIRATNLQLAAASSAALKAAQQPQQAPAVETPPNAVQAPPQEPEGEPDEFEPEPFRILLPRLNYQSMTDELVPVSTRVATEALQFLFCSRAWHDDPELLHRKVRRWKGELFDGGWEQKARAMRAENPARWTFARIAKQLAVPRPQVEALFRAKAS